MTKKKLISELVLKDILITTASINYLNNHLSERNQSFGSVNLTDISFLLLVKEIPGITQYELAKSFNTTTQRVSYSVGKLLNLNYIKGVFKKINNRKTKELFLEEKGEKLIDDLEKYLLIDVFSSLTENDSLVLVNLLKRYESFHLDFLSKLNDKPLLNKNL